ncbi:MAG TPA: hypothetical protein VHH73_10275, partial [Verrucomicrobiae bacterium]|nr:hypothetical protein [Verrucomicrobiae bacterium]
MQFWIGMRKERFRIGSYLNPSGCEVYRVSGRQIDGAQVRRNFKSYEEALAYRGELEIAALNVVEAVKLKRTRLSDAELSEAEAAFQKLAGGGQTLTQAVEYFLRNWKPALIPKTVQAAYDEFLAEKKAQRLRQRSMEDLKHRVGRFVRLNGTRYLNEITAEEVKPFVALPGRSARTRNGNRRSLLNFFRWCMKLDYCVANPLMKIDPAKVDEIHPK